MDKKWKLALAALLGFSAACSSVKNAPTKGETQQKSDTVAPSDSVRHRRVIVMYGVRAPQGVVTWSPAADSTAQKDGLDPVAEKAGDDVPAASRKPAQK
ncbi:MAG: hypothetical protein RRY33_08505 [Alistipes sp.]